MKTLKGLFVLFLFFDKWINKAEDKVFWNLTSESAEGKIELWIKQMLSLPWKVCNLSGTINIVQMFGNVQQKWGRCVYRNVWQVHPMFLKPGMFQTIQKKE